MFDMVLDYLFVFTLYDLVHTPIGKSRGTIFGENKLSFDWTSTSNSMIQSLVYCCFLCGFDLLRSTFSYE